MKKTTALLAVLGAYLATPIDLAAAQAAATAESDDQTFDTIVVTARSRTETVLEAPISITAITGEQLEQRQITSMSDLAAMTPGLQFQQAASATSSRPLIRGMTQLGRSSGDVANVGVFVDGVYSPGMSGIDMSFVGLERVEVVRGPQSAAYGRNTFAGAINYITRRPSNDVEYGGSVTVGENLMGGITLYGSAPLVEDVLAVRLDAALNDSGGYFTNQVNGERLNRNVGSIVRLGVNFTPTQNISMYGSLSWSQDEASPSPLIVIPDSSPRRVGKPAGTARTPNQIGRRVAGEITDYSETFSFDDLAHSERESTRAMLVTDLDIGAFTLSARTGYEQREVSTLVDLDQTPNGTLLSGVWRQTASGDIEDRWEFSQDFRLQPRNSGDFNWVVGAYYSYENNDRADVRFASPAFGTTAPAPVNGRALVDYGELIRNEFYSAYASVDYHFAEYFTITAEGRYTWERKRATVLENNYGSDAGTLGDYTNNFEYFSPRVILEYQPSSTLNFYLSAAQGTKSGGANPEASLASEQEYDPESNWTYELGAKASFLNNTLQVAASLYHIDWTDQQILVFATGVTPATSITGNIGESKVDGFEIGARWRPLSWLAIDASYNYNDARYENAVTSSFAGFVDCADLPRLECIGGVTTGRLDGNAMQFTPEHQGTLGIELTVPAFTGWEWYARTDVTADSRRYVDAGNVGWVPGSEQVRLRFGIQSDTLRFMGFCNNLFEDTTPVTAFESRDFLGTPHYYVRAREGRMCGVTVGASF
ncbi:MAG TPA: TonB-dependent receptor [Terricaulis sp.]|nr:TonB-dependent receptor [Terricaulis sp.]